ncbi:MAG: hypothetical protein JST28_16370 [Acidobacteria bacterium]|nr:hypothetical protein [Acidobacteriota bacterium]
MTLDTNLALFSEVAQAIVIGLLIFRKIYQKLPLFFSYNIFLVVLTAASFPIQSRYPLPIQQRIFVIGEIVDALFLFCVLVELSMSILSPIRSKLPSWTVFGVAGILAAALGIIWPFAKTPGFAALNDLSQIQVHVDVATSALRIVFFLALAAFSQLLSLSWRDRELQIGTGLGFYALVSLSATLWKMHVGTATLEAVTTYHQLDRVQVGGYVAAMIYWVVCFAQDVPDRRDFTPKMEKMIINMAYAARVSVERSDADKRKKKEEKKNRF